jgi:DNA modification methylase
MWVPFARRLPASKQLNSFRVRNGWKPILVFHKPPKALPPDWLNDYHVGGGEEKDHHHWEQPVSEAAYLIQRLTNGGDLIVDVTCGSGSSLVAAKLAGRRWIGIDADVSAVQVSRLRLREAVQEQAPTIE